MTTAAKMKKIAMATPMVSSSAKIMITAPISQICSGNPIFANSRKR
jgi:hypothetical protein